VYKQNHDLQQHVKKVEELASAAVSSLAKARISRVNGTSSLLHNHLDYESRWSIMHHSLPLSAANAHKLEHTQFDFIATGISHFPWSRGACFDSPITNFNVDGTAARPTLWHQR
jgi:hypothetical protein